MNYPFDLGDWSRQITTESESAQLWFDRGLNWTYGYNHDEAAACFKRAIEADANCAMAWWGVAYASGPFYNRPWIRYSDTEITRTLPICFEAVSSALSNIDRAAPVEQALIHALAKRYQSGDETNRNVLNSWMEQYADAMRGVYHSFNDDPDVAALYAEAAITCTPRQLWNLKSGEPNPEARTNDILPVLDTWLAKLDRRQVVHPGLLHMHWPNAIRAGTKLIVMY